MKDAKTIFITGGKTGGHIYPAVSIAKELLGLDEKIFYIGNKKNLEYEIAKREGFNFLSIDVDAMPRKVSLKFFFWGIKTLLASFKAIFYMLKYRPDSVFATGGFVCAPTLIAAIILKVPYVLHDCDAYPGLVSRAFAKNATSVSIAFRDAKGLINNKNTYFRGNPIREDFFTISKTQARQELGLKDVTTVLIMGGSQGAKSINSAAVGLVKYFKDKEDFQIILQTGAKNYNETLEEIGEVPKNAIVAPYFENMALPLLASDVAISRAGSLSISELCSSGLPSILVPYPYSAADHQRHNAKNMEELGASLFLEDKDCNSGILIKLINGIILNPSKLCAMKSCAQAESRPNATREIAQQILEASNK